MRYIISQLTLILPFSLLHSELRTYLIRKSYPPPQSVSVCRTDLMASDLINRYVCSLFFLCFSYISFWFYVSVTCGWLKWPAVCSTFWHMLMTDLLTEWVNDWLIDWLIDANRTACQCLIWCRIPGTWPWQIFGAWSGRQCCKSKY